MVALREAIATRANLPDEPSAASAPFAEDGLREQFPLDIDREVIVVVDVPGRVGEACDEPGCEQATIQFPGGQWLLRRSNLLGGFEQAPSGGDRIGGGSETGRSGRRPRSTAPPRRRDGGSSHRPSSPSRSIMILGSQPIRTIRSRQDARTLADLRLARRRWLRYRPPPASAAFPERRPRRRGRAGRSRRTRCPRQADWKAKAAQ